MRKNVFIPIFLVILVIAIKFFSPEKPYAALVEGHQSLSLSLQVDSKPIVYKPSKIGINLGRWTSWGTQQFSHNILMNPGFEGKIDRIVVIVSQSNGTSFSDEAGWGYPDNYWNEAEFDVRTGVSAGKKGVIKESLNSGENGLPQYFSRERMLSLQENDVIVLTKEIRTSPVDYWSVNKKELVQYDPFEKRTESPGSQSIKMTPTRISHAVLSYFADATANKTGKMLPINGKWELTFWAKADSSGAELEVSFSRENGSVPFVKEIIYPTDDWQEYTLDFNAVDKGNAEHLKLTMTAVRPDISIWVDDISLQPEGGKNTIFRKQIVEALKILNPSYLREFTHLGDTWENRIASQFGRKSFTYRVTGKDPQSIYSYSLQDYLDLCSEILANPWIVVPPTFSDYECRQLGIFLSKYAGKERFSDVLVEFGTDNWNWLYRPVGIPYYKEHGEVAHRDFELILKEIKNKSNVRFLVNGQYSNPENSLKFIENTKSADGLAITPYFFHSLDKATPDDEVLNKLFNQDGKLIRTISDELFARGKFLAISEINLHTTEGDAKAYERNRVAAGAASGSALAKKILECMFSGADPILVNGLGQFDTKTWDIDEFVNLWGVTRDFGSPPLFRPTGLAVIMLNQVIGGNMYSVSPIGDSSLENELLTIASFKNPIGWTAAIVSKHNTPLNLEIQFPYDGHPLPNKALTLLADDPFQTNEFNENVKIVETNLSHEDRIVKITVPPWGFVVLKK